MSQPPRVQALSVPRHQCNHCSACCSSYRIGPLLADDIDRLTEAVVKVKQKFPNKDLSKSFLEQQHKGRTGVFLSKRGGMCVFFEQGIGCTIHNAAGGEEKPLVCQLFPLQIVDTGEALRLGIRPTCLSDDRSWADGPVVSGELIEVMAHHPVGPVKREADPAEQATLAVVMAKGFRTGRLLSFIAEADQADAGVPEIDVWLTERLGDLFAAADEVASRFQEGDQGPLHPMTSTAKTFARLRQWHTDASPDVWPEVDERWLGHVQDAVSRLVFLRETALFPGLPWALLSYVAVSRWANAWALAVDPDDFGVMFSSLLVILESPFTQRALLDAGPPFH